MNSRSSQPILLVEDSPEDYEVTVRALEKTGVTNPIFRCASGDEALDFMHRRGDYVNPNSAPRPGIILLDLNLPGTDGREVLLELKRDAAFRSIPIVVLTTSGDERDIRRSYDAGANSYVQKPVSLHEFLRVIAMVKEYWLNVVTLPVS